MSEHHEFDSEAFARRMALKFLGVAAFSTYALGSLIPVHLYLSSPARRQRNAELTEVVAMPAADLHPGAGRVTAFGDIPVILVRLPDGRLVARSAECTHLGCTVGWNPAEQHIVCACHGAVFEATTGAPINGPATVPLPAFRAFERDGSIIIARAEA